MRKQQAPFSALSALLVLAIAAAVPDLAAERSEPFPLPQLTELDLDVRLDYQEERLEGTAVLTLRNVATEPLVRVPLLLNRLMGVEAVRQGGRILEVSQDVVTFDDVTTFQVRAAAVELAEPLPPGASVRLAVSYAGHLVGYTEVGWLYVRDHIDRDFTVLREDALAFPVVGAPSFEMNRSAPREPFEFRVAVTVPEGLVVATGGEDVGRQESEGGVTWRSRSRLPSPFLVVAIAPYGVVEEGGLRVYHLPGDEDGAREALAAARRAAERLQSIFGPLGRPLALHVMEIPDGWGSQASLAGGVIQEAATFRGGGFEPLYHELSHLWNAADLDAPSPRWNEGLAMFLQGRLARELDGREGEPAALERTERMLVERCVEGSPCAEVPLRRYGEEGLTDLSYSVGRLMFAALYAGLGEAAFDRALRRHFRSHTDGGTTDDLVRAFVEEGGEPARELFDVWLESVRWLDGLRAAPSSGDASR